MVELDTLLSAQWTNGMIPHIVFANGVDGYFPGPARWACSALSEHAPKTRHTSASRSPVHAIAVQRIPRSRPDAGPFDPCGGGSISGSSVG